MKEFMVRVERKAIQVTHIHVDAKSKRNAKAVAEHLANDIREVHIWETQVEDLPVPVTSTIIEDIDK